MDFAAMQKRIDGISWYHEFDFGNGLKARGKETEEMNHRRLWGFLQSQLNQVDFRGKSVLDIGCWDGYWSFEAERRGARRVLATDDVSQNWANGEGVHLAKELLGSRIEINQQMSVYKLASLGETFDIILFLGVYYHLFDPFYALAQIRHCCHPKTVVLLDGPVALALRADEMLYNFRDHNCELLPSQEALEQLLQAAYLKPVRHDYLEPPPPPPRPFIPTPPGGDLGWKWRLRICWESLSGSRARVRKLFEDVIPPPGRLTNRRMFMECAPFEGVNDLYAFRPHFGLHAYDPRFRGVERVAA